MDAVLIEGLALEAEIGVHPHERGRRQPLLLDLVLATDMAAAAASDALADTIDYAAVVQALRGWVAAAGPLLLERLAAELAGQLQARFQPAGLELTLRKPEAAAALGCGAVGVRLRRGSLA